jgi:hypothetical protein
MLSEVELADLAAELGWLEDTNFLCSCCLEETGHCAARFALLERCAIQTTRSECARVETAAGWIAIWHQGQLPRLGMLNGLGPQYVCVPEGGMLQHTRLDPISVV